MTDDDKLLRDLRDPRFIGQEALRGAAADRIEELLVANRTRPDYDLHCQQCGRAHILDTTLPSDVWNRIASPDELLCTVCIDDRLAEAGLVSEAEFHYAGTALVSKRYACVTEDDRRLLTAGRALARAEHDDLSVADALCDRIEELNRKVHFEANYWHEEWVTQEAEARNAERERDVIKARCEPTVTPPPTLIDMATATVMLAAAVGHPVVIKKDKSDD